jgi:hypothetical protein
VRDVVETQAQAVVVAEHAILDHPVVRVFGRKPVAGIESRFAEVIVVVAGGVLERQVAHHEVVFAIHHHERARFADFHVAPSRVVMFSGRRR